MEIIVISSSSFKAAVCILRNMLIKAELIYRGALGVP